MKYEKFKLVVKLMKRKDHLKIDGLGYILKLTLGMNTNKYSKRREELIEKLGVKGDVKMPMLVRMEQPLDPDYVSGLSDGDGSFYIGIKDGRKLKPGFSIIQTGDDGEELLRLVKRFFNGVGGVYRYGDIVRYIVSSVPELLREVIPHYTNHPIHTRKEGDLRLLEKVCLKLNSGGHNQEGISELITLVKNAKGRV